MTVPPDGYRPRIGSLDIVRDLAMVLMTLGPLILALPLVEGAQGRVARWLNVFGRVPLFYYLLHIPLIHLVAAGVVVTPRPGA